MVIFWIIIAKITLSNIILPKNNMKSNFAIRIKQPLKMLSRAEDVNLKTTFRNEWLTIYRVPNAILVPNLSSHQK